MDFFSLGTTLALKKLTAAGIAKTAASELAREVVSHVASEFLSRADVDGAFHSALSNGIGFVARNGIAASMPDDILWERELAGSRVVQSGVVVVGRWDAARGAFLPTAVPNPIQVIRSPTPVKVIGERRVSRTVNSVEQEARTMGDETYIEAKCPRCGVTGLNEREVDVPLYAFWTVRVKYRCVSCGYRR